MHRRRTNNKISLNSIALQKASRGKDNLNTIQREERVAQGPKKEIQNQQKGWKS